MIPAADPGGGQRWTEAMIAARLFAADPAGFGGVVLRARAGPLRDRWLANLKSLIPPGRPVRKAPANVDAERLLGGLDLVATLEAGRPVARAGLLADCDGGVVILAMAERLDPASAALVAAALDVGEIVAERDGVALRHPARFGVVALDEGVEDEAVAAALAERMAFVVDVDGLSIHDARFVPVERRNAAVVSEDAALAALCGTAAALGIDSARAPLFALRAARALAGANAMSEDDIALAARLVLASRARMLPQADASPDENDAPERDDGDGGDGGAMADRVVEAVRAALPPGVLAALAEGVERSKGAAGRGGKTSSGRRGRPAGLRSAAPRGGERLSVAATLRAAAPWQRLRGARDGRIAIRADDLRVRRFKEAKGATTIFVVDASGSAAAERLAEAKGAVELLLAEAYVKRTEVALVAFRGTGAEVLLPPTRSLTRARRCLGALPGGGGTPIAEGILAGTMLAGAARDRGRTPFVVLMTDGRANVARDGSGSRARAGEEALAAARALRADGIGAVLIDIAALPRPEAARIAEAMGARYLALPRLDAGSLGAAMAG